MCISCFYRFTQIQTQIIYFCLYKIGEIDRREARDIGQGEKRGEGEKEEARSQKEAKENIIIIRIKF